MAETRREQRTAELRALQHSDPRVLIDLYCQTAGQLSSKQMPQGLSFSRMIESIVDRETLPADSAHATG